jgi:glycosyltransferase A (GT-A) superfamily protein (DUF2064 family)
MTPSLVIIAKAPVAGRSKTRLCPPCTPEEAAWLAEAALRDTLAAALATPARRRVLVLEGAPGEWLPSGFEVIRQRGGTGLAERLTAAFDDVGGPAFLIGMDTPQVTPRLLAAGLDVVARGSAAFGSAPDGGYWAIGLPHPDSDVFAGVPMSEADTGRIQRRRLRRLGFPITDLPALRDVDTIDDARAAAAAAPHSSFAHALHAIDRIAA